VDAGVLALDIGGTKLSAGIGAADGEVTRQESEPTRGSEGAAVVLQRAVALARRCLDAELAAGGRVAGVGVSTMGYTRAAHVELAPNVPGWESLAIRDELSAAFPGHRIVIGNDVKLAARAEMAWGALRGVQEGVYVNLGTGIAAGIVSGGRQMDGAHGAAGEIGYTLHRGRTEPRMAAEGAAPLEEWLGGAGVARRLAQTELPPTVAELVQRGDDAEARTFLDELWTGIAIAAANLCIATDPSVLVVGGGYVRGESGLLDRVREIAGRAVPYPPEVVPARFGADASLRGAVAAALTVAGDEDLGAGSTAGVQHQ
jgi:predicted NBD/HSP70 family sugar kinase